MPTLPGVPPVCGQKRYAIPTSGGLRGTIPATSIGRRELAVRGVLGINERPGRLHDNSPDRSLATPPTSVSHTSSARKREGRPGNVDMRHSSEVASEGNGRTDHRSGGRGCPRARTSTTTNVVASVNQPGGLQGRARLSAV